MKQIEHEGIVIQSLNNQISVRVTSQAACASCHAKTSCTAADVQDKIINVNSTRYFTSGERVMVSASNGLGLKAAWWAYVLPTVIVLATLVISFAVTGNETISGLLALVILVPYYTGLKLLDNKMRKSFSFTIKSIIE